MALLVFVLFDCRATMSNARAEASNITCTSDVGLVNGELDAGVKVSVTVKNVGKAGFINIKPELSTSEGEWTRSQNLQFNAGETKTLTYFFHEPTVNASSIQCRIEVSPKAD
jgi:hypothetical protein